MRLPGAYKSRRNRRTWQGTKLVIACAACDWKSALARPEKAERQYLQHIALVHEEKDKATELLASCSKQDG